MAIMEISVVPLGTRKTSMSELIVDSIKVLEHHGIKYHITPMCTVAEGDIHALLGAAVEMHEAVFRQGDIKRALTSIKIDDRRDIPATMDRKMKSLKEKVKYKK